MSDLGILGGDLSIAPSLAGAASGWASGARALTGLPATNQLAFQRGALGGAQTASALELARERRDKNLALASITPEAIADPAQANALAAAALRGGVNLQELQSGLFTRQKAAQEQQLFDEAGGGTPISGLNSRLAVMHGEPVKLTSVEGNTLIDPYETPLGQAAIGGNVPTALGQAAIGADQARAAASYASAARQRAGIGADKAANYDIVQDQNGNLVRVNKLDPTDAQPVLIGGKALTGAPKGGKGAGPSLPSPDKLKLAFGSEKVGGGANDDARAFFAWQAQQAQTDPAFNNGDYALAQYALRQSGVSQAANQTAAAADELGLGDVARNKVLSTKGLTVIPVNDGSNAVVTPSGQPVGVGTPAPGGGVTIKRSAISSLPAPKSQADYDALPPGSKYLYTDGTVQVKGG